MDRRSLLLAGVAVAGGALALGRHGARAAPEHFAVELTPAQWHGRLNADQFAILREQETERPWSSPLLNEHRHGVFACVGCAQKLFDSRTKFESGTGWPSFYAPLANAVATSRDASLPIEVRTEVHCVRCGGHLGHVFDDGPQPTGLRYCMNGAAMTFQAT
ncbi:MAG: peptide-methionine (R)-S-oxide reductase MsrB [Caulobacteraceae bacterium]